MWSVSSIQKKTATFLTEDDIVTPSILCSVKLSAVSAMFTGAFWNAQLVASVGLVPDAFHAETRSDVMTSAGPVHATIPARRLVMTAPLVVRALNDSERVLP